jgi:hypothetical protein
MEGIDSLNVKCFVLNTDEPAEFLITENKDAIKFFENEKSINDKPLYREASSEEKLHALSNLLYIMNNIKDISNINDGYSLHINDNNDFDMRIILSHVRHIRIKKQF